MNRRDINSINDIFRMIITEAAKGGSRISTEGSTTTYTEEGNLRINKFALDNKPVVLFYTLQGQGDQPDILHRVQGPALTFESGGPGNEYYFLEGELYDEQQWKDLLETKYKSQLASAEAGKAAAGGRASRELDPRTKQRYDAGDPDEGFAS